MSNVSVLTVLWSARTAAVVMVKVVCFRHQIVPFAVMDIFKSLPGMPGLFLASLFSASLR